MEEAVNVDDIPIEQLDLNVDIETTQGLEGLAQSDKYYIESLKAEKKRSKERRYCLE